MSLIAAISTAVSWPGEVRGHDVRSSRPQVLSARRQAWYPEAGRRRMRKIAANGRAGLGDGNGAQDGGLVVAVRKAIFRELEPRHAQECEEQADDGGEDAHCALQLADRGQELPAIVFERVDGDDVARAASVPRGDGGARDIEAVPQRADARAADLLTEAVVVRVSLPGLGAHDHGRRIAEAGA